jgi:hypothetical protein
MYRNAKNLLASQCDICQNPVPAAERQSIIPQRRRVLRAQHVKNTGCVMTQFIVEPGLPGE